MTSNGDSSGALSGESAPKYNTDFVAHGSSSSSTTPSTSGVGGVSTSRRITIMALTENRTKEIGMAVMDLSSPEITLSQYFDSQNYINTLTKLHIYEPNEVLLQKTINESELSILVKNKYRAEVVLLARKYFNETRGAECAKEYGAKDMKEIESSKYLALASLAGFHYLSGKLLNLAALMKYVEYIQHITFAVRSLKISYMGCDGAMLLDSHTIANLELIVNTRTGDKTNSLYGMLNHTKTVLGARLLRINLVQPSADLATIRTRYDCVEEFINNEERFFETTRVLSNFLDLDHLISSLVQIPKVKSLHTIQRQITSIIYLKKMLEQMPRLRLALSNAKSALAIAICQNIENPEVEVLQGEIEKYIKEDTTMSKNSLHMRMQICFAVRPGISGLLDVARKTYSETVEDIHSLVNRYREEFHLPGLKLQYNARRGHFLGLYGKTSPLPGAIQVVSKGKKCIFSTEQLVALNERQKESLQEILVLTDRVLDELVDTIRKALPLIYKLSESIAMLDFILSLATFCTTTDSCVRPELTADGPIGISQNRHPIYEKTQTEPFIPNNTFLSPTSNFHIITGPNMSGKSTYIRAVALNVILAQIGCFVPAKFFSTRVVDRLFTRIGTSDNIEENASTFLVEMREMAHIIQNASNNSLIIVDELGRGTSTRDGVAIAWSMCEHLAALPAYTLFVTHFFPLSDLEKIYPNIKNFHLMVDTQDNRPMYTVGPGAAQLGNYGIRLAKLAGFPPEVLQEAQHLSKKLAFQPETGAVDDNYITKISFQLVQKLIQLKNSTLSEDAVRSYLISLSKKFFNQTAEESSHKDQQTLPQ